MATTNTYFAQAGDDSTGAGTIGNPYQNYYTFETSMNADTTFYLNKGDTWRHTTQEQINDKGGTSGLPFTMTGYGSGNDPIITPQWLLTSGWVSYATNIYRQATNAPQRVYFDDVVQDPQTSTSLTSSRTWYHDGTYLYIYSTSDPNGTVNVEYNQSSGTVEALRFKNGAYTVLDGIQCNGRVTFYRFPATGESAGIQVQNCTIGRCNDRGFTISLASTGIIFSANTLLNTLTANETTNDDNGNRDAIELTTSGTCSAAYIQYNVITDWTHSGVEFDQGLTGIISGFDIAYNEMTNPNAVHGRAWGLQGRDTGSGTLSTQNGTVRWNYDHTSKSHNHCCTYSTLYYGNVTDGHTGATFNNGLNISAVDTQESWNNDVFNNIVTACSGSGIRFVHDAANPTNESKNNTVRNNFSYGNGTYALEVWNYTVLHDNTISYNVLYDDGTTETGLISYRGSTYTVAGFEAALSNSDVASNNDYGVNGSAPTYLAGSGVDAFNLDPDNNAGLIAPYDTSAYNDRDGYNFNAVGAFHIGAASGSSTPVENHVWNKFYLQYIKHRRP